MCEPKTDAFQHFGFLQLHTGSAMSNRVLDQLQAGQTYSAPLQKGSEIRKDSSLCTPDENNYLNYFTADQCTTQNLTSKEGNQLHIKNTKGPHEEVLITAKMLYDVNYLKSNQMTEDDVIYSQGRGCLLEFIFIVIKINHTKSH